jgi:hypothetical protein
MTRAVLALFLLAGVSPPGAFAAEPRFDPCRLLTRREIGEIAGGRIVETKATGRVAGDLSISDCFYRSEPFADSVSLEVTRRARSSSRSVQDHWRAVFHAERGSEEEESRAEGPGSGVKEKESPPRPVEGVGDEAFWLGNPASGALYVLKGDRYLRISVGGAGEESVKMQKAADLARKALGRF